MAHMYPEAGPAEGCRSAAERTLYYRLRASLGADFHVIHSAQWNTVAANGRMQPGEADFVVIHPRLGVAILEVKGGRISYDSVAGRWYTLDRYDHQERIRDPFTQAMRSAKVLERKLQSAANTRPFAPTYRVCYGVWFPDMTWARDGRGALRLLDEQVLDQADVDDPEAGLRRLLRYAHGSVPAAPLSVPALAALLGLLAPDFSQPESPLSVAITAEANAITRLTQEQAERLFAMWHTHRQLAIPGHAGTGKTAMALEMAWRLARTGQRVLIVCTNLTLAEHLRARIVRAGDRLPPPGQLEIHSLKELVSAIAAAGHLRQGEVGPLAVADARDQAILASIFAANLAALAQRGTSPMYDALLVDEAQDIDAPFWPELRRLLRASDGADDTEDAHSSQFYVFFDPAQRDLPGDWDPTWPGVPMLDPPLTVNCRNTGAIYGLMAAFNPRLQGVPFVGPAGLPVRYFDPSASRVSSWAAGAGAGAVVPAFAASTAVDAAPPTVGSASASSVDAETLALEWVLTDLVEREGIRPEQILVVTCRGGDGRSKAPTRWRVREQQQLGRRTLEWLRSTRSPTRIALGTIRSSKGLESPVVVLAELDGLARDAKHDQLLYTAISRAKHQLIVLAPPEALAPRQSGLWERFGSDPSEPTTLAGATATSDDPALVSPDDAAPEVDRDLASDAAPPAASLARSARAEVARATSARAHQANAQAVVGQPSSYQQAIFDFVQHGQGDGIVDAVAGSGKTTTLVAAAARLETRSAIFLAFNRHVAEVLRQRLRGTPMVAKTIHGIGFVTLTRYLAAPLHLDPHKYAKLCRRAARTAFASLGPAHQRQVADTLTELVNLARLTLTPAAEGARMRTLAGHHDVSCDAAPLDHLLRLVPELLTYGVRMAEADPNDTDRSDDGGGGSGGTGQTTAEAEQPWHVIDYTDMLYLPYVWQLPARWRSDWVFVDEAQDLNAAQLDLALKCRAPGGRVLFVGDPHQAIYGFSGADTAAFTAIQHATGAKAFPLSISYRCPKRHVALARDLVPQIESRPDAEEGIVEHIDPTQVPSLVQRGDLILCRKTAPLVELCITLLRHRVHAHVAGREIGTGLSQVVEDVTQLDGYTWQRFGHALDEYQHQQTAKLRHVDNAEREIERLQDRVEALRTCYVLFPARDAADLCQRIDDLFREERPQVTLSTVHRAKGLEADRVFILQPEAMPLRWPNQQPWELEQEDNIKYVALTRARKALYLVASPAS